MIIILRSARTKVNLFKELVNFLVSLESSTNLGSVPSVRAIAGIISRGGPKRNGWFRITIFDNRMRGDNAKPRLERVVVAGQDGEENDAAHVQTC